MEIKVYTMAIQIDHFSKRHALESLKRLVAEIEAGVTDISECPTNQEPCLPYTWVLCEEDYRVVTDSWLENNPGVPEECLTTTD